MRDFSLISGLILTAMTMMSPSAIGQIPGMPAAPKAAPAPDKSKSDAVAAPTKDNPDATVAETTGPISVDNTVSDRDVAAQVGEAAAEVSRRAEC